MSRKRKPAEVTAEGSGELDVRAIEDVLEAGEAAEGGAAEGVSVPATSTDVHAHVGAAEGASVPETDVHAHVGAAEGVDVPETDVHAHVGAPDEAAEEEGEAAELPTSAAGFEPERLKRLVEALIFASDKPVTIARLRQLTRVGDVRLIEQCLEALHEEYRDRGIALQAVSGGYQMRTNPQYSGWVQQLIAGRPVRLSRAQLETLAIVAYRQPITRPEIDEIRGVDSSNTLRVLTDRSLIRVLGKKEEVGRPLLYGTTKEFLDFFSLGDLRELPTLREYSELTAESRQVVSERLGVDLDAPPGEAVSAHEGEHEVSPELTSEPGAEPVPEPVPEIPVELAAELDPDPMSGDPEPEARGPDLE